VEIDAARRKTITTSGITTAGAIELDGVSVRVVASLEDLEHEKIDAVFVAVKATATSLVAAAIADTVDPDATIISWQNGIDTERALAEHLSRDRVVRAVVNMGVSFARDETVTVAFHNPPHELRELGTEGVARAESVAALLSGAGIPAVRSDDLLRSVWQKAALNAALNPVCALTGLTVRDVWHDAFGGPLARALLREAISVARANEIFLGSEFYRYALDYLDRAGTHKPSMLLDVQAGRRTEVDFINGKVVEYGSVVGVPTPHNETLLALVKAAERSFRMSAGDTEEKV
jgi:2-dehydropantoate 2-reductase